MPPSTSLVSSSASKMWAPSGSGALQAGEVLSGVVLPVPVAFSEDNAVEYEHRRHPWVIVLSQGCDLDKDYAHRTSRELKPGDNKELPHILLCEALSEEEFSPTVKSRVGKKRDLELALGNRDQRYHLLEAVPAAADKFGDGTPSLGLDFKRVFTLPTSFLYRQLDEIVFLQRRAVLQQPYEADLLQRFHAFMGRVGLPD